jgi:hypothetical protein
MQRPKNLFAAINDPPVDQIETLSEKQNSDFNFKNLELGTQLTKLLSSAD